jgi:tetratricopeptide (TPR) repeat protein
MEIMVKLGVILFACTAAIMVAEFFTRRRRPFPVYGWIGLISLAIGEWLMFRGVEPVATFFTPIAWTAYALIADAAVFAIRGRSRLRNAPVQFARLALLSVPLWLIFEAYNLRLGGWTYGGGIPLSLPARLLGYAWAYATIWPGIFLTADLIKAFGWWHDSARPIIFWPAAQRAFIVIGVIFLIVPVILPRSTGSFLFGAVWVGFIFLLDPINFRLGLPSFEADLASGRRGRFFSFLISGFVCGWLWEFWNFWAAAKWNYIFPIMQKEKIFEMPVLGYLGFLPFALECFVMYYFAAWLLGWEKPFRRQEYSHAERLREVPAQIRSRSLALVPWLFLALMVCSRSAHASPLNLPDTARQGLDLLYAGHPDDAITQFRQVQGADPGSPLGYILEAEARWWQIYCEACEIKWNTIDAYERPRIAADEDYLRLTGKVTSIAESRIAQADSAEMQLYAGIGWAQRARLLGLRNDRRGTARAGVNARTHLLRCLQLDPEMADAYSGLGLYNYYVDTLSPIARFLRFFMGIPGGSKAEGVRQLEIAMEKGTLTRVDARFYLAKNLRMYDHEYARSLEVLSPLMEEFPRNPIFQLLQGDILAKLGRRDPAAESFREAGDFSSGDTLCDRHLHALAQELTTTLAGANSDQ